MQPLRIFPVLVEALVAYGGTDALVSEGRALVGG